MSRATGALALWLALLLMLPAGAGRAQQQEGIPRALSRHSLGNFTYSCGLDQNLRFSLQNGLFSDKEPYLAGRSKDVSANLVQAAWGTVPDAGETGKAAAVVYVYNTGGTGHYYQLSLVGVCMQQPCELACTALGDRVQLQDVDITAAGAITARMVVHGDNDPACCPTKHVTRTWIYESADESSGLLRAKMP